MKNIIAYRENIFDLMGIFLDRRVPADLRADPLSIVPPTSPDDDDDGEDDDDDDGDDDDDDDDDSSRGDDDDDDDDDDSGKGDDDDDGEDDDDENVYSKIDCMQPERFIVIFTPDWRCLESKRLLVLPVLPGKGKHSPYLKTALRAQYTEL
ncbi:hypothetical protein PoB_005274500 [Plakobranchus ocellatus]|uniref:Uncharacterized protein n=1 Tax=Plakobranchus ocellatus TaxID=259542 RepID=A0AAV4C3P2_9GAST|nr:hypothetical protein PoB_005274500 [Plakobranchus ocellatus]